MKYPVNLLLKLMGINPSGYYKWLKRKDTPNRHEQNRLDLTTLLLEKSKGHKSWGYPPQRSDGKQAGCLTTILHTSAVYIKTGEGFEYLCKVKDVMSGVVLGESMMDNMKAELVVQAIKNAIQRWHLREGAVFHSDRGSQYTSSAVREFLKKRKLRQSFSRVGKPGDNAWSESFFANFKKEAVHWRWFPTREQARQAVFAYIEGFYNTRRVQKRLGYLSPKEWLKYWMDERLELTA